MAILYNIADRINRFPVNTYAYPMLHPNINFS